MCSIVGCSNGVAVGAHVVAVNIDRGSNFQHWIVPLCHGCNMSADDLVLDSRVALISANTKEMGCY